MHTVKLLLKTTAYDKTEIEKRFHACNNVHNTLVKHASKLLIALDHDMEYQNLLSEYKSLLKIPEENRDDNTIVKMKGISKTLTSIRKSMGLSEAGLQRYIKIHGKQFSKLISSQQIQKEATRVWQGITKVLFSNGEQIHFKKFHNLSTISGKTNTNGIKFDKEQFSIKWIGLNIKCRYPKGSTLDYVITALDDDISYCEIKREMFPNGYHYYVIIYLKGTAPFKLNVIGNETSGIDPGTSTMAVVSGSNAKLCQLPVVETTGLR